MRNQAILDQSNYDWQPCQILLPRLGLFLDRHGVRTRMIWPGRYMVRKSRSMKKWMYRNP